MFTVELYAKVRHAVMIEGLSRREAAKRFWHSSEHDHEDAEFFRSAWISAARAAGVQEAWTFYGVD
jgi:hypothetical protein